ncbi:hypothetical protein [Flavobacterium sp.]|uniref:hypothetical protein n=1 Tax=Flavobacterium sp. TaxID=239 RepID=UPI00286CDF73|nr:hypothetical protein [Flavobacterium sp.]
MGQSNQTLPTLKPVLNAIPILLGDISKDNIKMIGDPVAPMTTANYNNIENKTFMLRITVFQETNQEKAPELCIDESTGDYYVTYFADEKVTVETYNAWYFAAANQPFVKKEIKVFNCNLDPKTSRGTVTTVIPSAH